MVKRLKYFFLSISVFYACANAASTTIYTVGEEQRVPGGKTVKYFRNDSILVGTAGGFDECTAPKSNCETLQITFEQSGSTPEANNMATGISSFPQTLKTIWIKGDATGFDALVSGGLQYALPTPAANTLIRFALTNAPTSAPLGWFQGPLPVGCIVSIEPNSADPFINATFPANGGSIFVGSRISPAPGFSALLAGSKVVIQRHPNLSVALADTAPLVISEDTTFSGSVCGISMDGNYRSTFTKSSNIISPTAASGIGGYTIAANKNLQLYTPDSFRKPLPAINFKLSEGGTASIETVSTPLSLPVVRI